MADEVKAPVQPIEPQAGTAGSAPAKDTPPQVVDDKGQAVPPKEGGESPKLTVEEGAEPGGEKTPVGEIIKLRKRAQTAETENARLQGIVEGMRMAGGQPAAVPPGSPAQPAGTTPLIPTKEPVEPNVDDFEHYDDYVKADRQYMIDKAAWNVAQAYQQGQEEDARRKRDEGFQGRVAEARKKYEDFDRVVLTNPAFVQSDAVATLIKESEFGADVAYHLATNPDDMRRLNALPPLLAAREFGKLESKLSAPPPTPEPRKLISQAPEPVQPVQPSAVVEKDEQELPVGDFIARRNAKDLARRRGQTV